jgi:transposase
MNSKLHAVTDAAGGPLRMFLTAGQRSDYIGARALLSTLPAAKHMLADRGFDADWYREALEDKGITPCIPSRKNRKVPIPHDETRYRTRHKIENSFALRTGGVSPLATTGARRSSCRHAHWLPWSCSGYES